MSPPKAPAKLLDLTLEPIKTEVNAGEGISFIQQLANKGSSSRFDVAVRQEILDPRTLEVIAFAYNGTVKPVNASLQMLITRAQAEILRPIFLEVCSYPSTMSQNATGNITVKADLDTLIKTITTQIDQPNGTTVTLTQDNNASDLASFTYIFNYTLNSTLYGTYKIISTVTDISDQVNQKNETYEVVRTGNVSLTGSGITTISLLNRCNSRIISSGSNITSINLPIGKYGIKAETSPITIIFNNITVNETLNEILNYTDIGETLSLPTDTRAVDQLELTINSSLFDYNFVNFTYDYSGKTGVISEENNLRIYRCHSQSSCTFIRMMPAYINTTTHQIRTNITNFSVYMLAESTATVTQTSSTPSGGGGGGGGGRSTSVSLVSLNIVQPGPISVLRSGTIVSPITIKNNGESFLFGINLRAESPNSNVQLEFTDPFIQFLAPGQEQSRELRITTNLSEEGPLDVDIIAQVTNPDISDRAKIFIDIIGGEAKGNADKQIVFVRDLFNNNPDCLELKELLTEAQKEFENKNYDKALVLTDSAINACKNLLVLKGKELEIPKKAVQVSDYMILSIELVAFLFMFAVLYNYYKRRKIRRGKI